MNYKLKILIIAWVSIIFILVLGWLGFDLISVVSNSMKHENETLFIQFWKKKGCDLACVGGFPISGGFQGGDLLIQKRTTEYKIGDVLAYQANCIYEDDEQKKIKCSDIIVHRLIDLDEARVFLKGDNIKETPKNNVSEEIIEKKFVVGKIIFKIPKLGLIKALLNCWGKRCNYIDCITNGNCN